MATDDKPKNEKPQPPADAPSSLDAALAEEMPLDIQLLDFWNKNKKTIIAAVCLVLIGVSVYSTVNWWIERQREKQGLALSDAKETKDFERVATEFRGENVGAYALLLLADEQYRAGKYEESAKTYQRVLDEYPQHPLAGSALYGKAAARESLGDHQGAINSYQGVVQSYGSDMHSPDARVSIARCEEARGNIVKARQAYEEVLAAYPNTQWAARAGMRITILERDARAKGQPLTPPPAAASAAAGSLMPTTPVAPVKPPSPAKPAAK